MFFSYGRELNQPFAVSFEQSGSKLSHENTGDNVSDDERLFEKSHDQRDRGCDCKEGTDINKRTKFHAGIVEVNLFFCQLEIPSRVPSSGRSLVEAPFSSILSPVDLTVDLRTA